MAEEAVKQSAASACRAALAWTRAEVMSKCWAFP